MEDAHTTLLQLDDTDASFFGVYDGHGGNAVHIPLLSVTVIECTNHMQKKALPSPNTLVKFFTKKSGRASILTERNIGRP